MSTAAIAIDSYTIVVEMENARTVSSSRFTQVLNALAAEIAQMPAKSPARPQLIFAHPGPDGESEQLVQAIMRAAPRLAEVARLQAVGVPEGRYYELKNAGIARADGAAIVLFDSDSVPEPGWLRALLAPLTQPQTIAVSGHTYLGHSGLISRTLALVWMFPLRDHDARAAGRRALNANNCAFRAAWLKAQPFPIDNGFKISCTKLQRKFVEVGSEVVRTEAYAEHAPLTGWRFIVWRALVTGRDADRRFAELRSPSRLRRLWAALKDCVKTECRVVRRVLWHHRRVALPLWQVPAALALGCGFYALAFVGQVARLCGLVSEHPERVPAFVENH